MTPPHPRQLPQLRPAREAVRQDHRPVRCLAHRREQLVLRAGDRDLVVAVLETEVAREAAAAAGQLAGQAGRLDRKSVV